MVRRPAADGGRLPLRWEDVLSNEDLTPGGISPDLLVDGKPPKFEIVDDLTVRYTLGWRQTRLPAAARGAAAAQHGHAGRTTSSSSTRSIRTRPSSRSWSRSNKEKNWTALHISMARQYRPENPDLPTLDPWRNTTKPPAEQFVFERNPYFHRVDENGPPAALYRPFRSQCQLVVDHPGQDRRRRNRSAGHRHRLRRLHLPQGGREALPDQGQVCGSARRARASRCCPISTSTTRSGASSCRTCASAAPCRWPSTGTRSTWPCSSGSANEAPTRCCRKARSIKPGICRRPGSRIDPRPGQCAARRNRPDEARQRRHPAAARRPPGRDHRRNRPAKSTLETDVLELDHRSLEQDRHHAVHPHLAARRLPQPRHRRPDDDGDLVGHRQRHADRRHESRRAGADQPTTSCNGRIGACTI